jgi:TetR/AcrR family transcriptional regulator, lmrAB and yxaGH operons repressor
VARPQSIEDDALISRLGCVFRDVGYEGASLALLSEATGLKKASLYHRFPRGKQQMADEVITAALNWYTVNIFEPMRGEGTPADRLAAVRQRLDEFYAAGRQACLLNMLAAPREVDGPFSAAIKTALEAIIDAFAGLAKETGLDRTAARARAERVVMLLHGCLVISRGLGSSEPFQRFLASLEDELIGR